MLKDMFKSKIHRATVTDADLHYEGSVAIDEDLLDASGILEYEKVDVWNITNGARLHTYAIKGRRGSGEICLNGAAARHFHVGDMVIIATFAMMNEKEIEAHKPTVVQVDAQNRIVNKDEVLV